MCDYSGLVLSYSSIIASVNLPCADKPLDNHTSTDFPLSRHVAEHRLPPPGPMTPRFGVLEQWYMQTHSKQYVAAFHRGCVVDGWVHCFMNRAKEMRAVCSTKKLVQRHSWF